MQKSKIILSLFISSLFLMSCKDKKKIEPEPKEYFSFTANGVHYDYPQEKKWGFSGESQTLWAGASSGSLGYFITAKNPKNDVARGRITFNFAESHIPTEDTIILDGVSNRTTVEWFLNQEAFYKLIPPQTGKIIFTERSNQRLTGFFEFDATLTTTPITGVVDTILHITNGKFSIIPTL